MFVLVTDFGLEGPYIGQMQRVLCEHAPAVPVVNLFADAPVHNPRATAYLLDAYRCGFPEGTVFVCVVDPAVGSDRHRPSVVRGDGCWFVGPDNGLFEIVRRRALNVANFEITWRPPQVSASFHGRDIYSPVAARLARGETVAMRAAEALRFRDWLEDPAEVIYIDRFGNAMTGVRAATVPPTARVQVGGHGLGHARTFASVGTGQAFWYENANGLLELAVNQGRADVALDLHIGDAIGIVTG